MVSVVPALPICIHRSIARMEVDHSLGSADPDLVHAILLFVWPNVWVPPLPTSRQVEIVLANPTTHKNQTLMRMEHAVHVQPICIAIAGMVGNWLVQNHAGG